MGRANAWLSQLYGGDLLNYTPISYSSPGPSPSPSRLTIMFIMLIISHAVQSCSVNKKIIRMTFIFAPFSKLGSLQFIMLVDTFSDSK